MDAGLAAIGELVGVIFAVPIVAVSMVVSAARQADKETTDGPEVRAAAGRRGMSRFPDRHCRRMEGTA